MFITSSLCCAAIRRLQRSQFPAGSWVLLSALLIGCQAPDARRSPAAPEQGAVAQFTETQDAVTPDPSYLTCGADLGRQGEFFHMATYAICGSTGTRPSGMADYEPYRVFGSTFANLTLVEGRTADGAPLLLAEAPAAAMGKGPLPAHFTPVVEGLEGAVGGPGISNGTLRALLLDPMAANLLFSAPQETILYTQLTGFLQNGMMYVDGFQPPRNAPAQQTSAEAQLGVRALILQGAINDAPSVFAEVEPQKAAQSPTGRPGTLEDLAALYGGRHPAGWINPYTTTPMREVPLTEATPGDYTELADPTGVVILLHYRDAEGGVSSRLIGNRRDHRASSGRVPMQSY